MAGGTNNTNLLAAANQIVRAINDIEGGGVDNRPNIDALAIAVSDRLACLCNVLQGLALQNVSQNGEPGIPPPPPPAVEDPGQIVIPPDISPEIHACRVARALARNIRHVLSSLGLLVSVNGLSPVEAYNVLRQLGLEGNTAMFISITMSVVTGVLAAVYEIVAALVGGSTASLYQQFIDVAGQIDDEFFTCEVSTEKSTQAIVADCKAKVDTLDAGLLLKSLVKTLIWEEKVANFMAGVAHDSEGGLVAIDWEAAGIPVTECCTPPLPSGNSFELVPFPAELTVMAGSADIKIDRLGRLTYRVEKLSAYPWQTFATLMLSQQDFLAAYPPQYYTLVGLLAVGIDNTLSNSQLRHASPTGGWGGTIYTTNIVINANGAHVVALNSAEEFREALAALYSKNVSDIIVYNYENQLYSLVDVKVGTMGDPVPGHFAKWSLGIVVKRIV